MDDVPDDDQYDTEDSFIDDAELVSFFIASGYYRTWILAIYLAMLLLWFCVVAISTTCSTGNALL